MSKVSQKLRDFITQRANYRCEYCRSPMWLTGIAHEIGHIIPKINHGPTNKDNLCLTCLSCKGYKQAKIKAIDPKTKQTISLFQPRQQNWFTHFRWSNDGTHVIGLTPCGRATVEGLNLNNPPTITARTIWVSLGYHPPDQL